MSYYRLIKKTLEKEKVTILLYFCTAISIVLFYYLLYSDRNIIYPIMFSFFFLSISLIYKYCVYRNLYIGINESKTSPGYKGAEDTMFEDIIDEIKDLHGRYINKIYALENKYEEREKLLVEWIHNMKTSVSVIELAIDKLPNDEAIEDIRIENNILKENLEGSLNIFRIEEFAKDYVPEKVNLKLLVKEVVNSQKRNFIYSKIYPKIDLDEELYVYTDIKWIKYVIKQVLSNAIKYSNDEGKVYIKGREVNDRVELYIKDEGIGIKKEEVTRVFEAFFTGSNGRKNSKSSGIGLYMCQNICEKLNHNIKLESTLNKGTKVTISF